MLSRARADARRVGPPEPCDQPTGEIPGLALPRRSGDAYEGREYDEASACEVVGDGVYEYRIVLAAYGFR